MTSPILKKGFAVLTGFSPNFSKLRQQPLLTCVKPKQALLAATSFSLIACSSASIPLNTASSSKQINIINEAPIATTEIENKQNPMLEQMLVAEFNLHRGNLNAAYKTYLTLAQEEQNLTAISRATDIAVAMNNLFLIEQASTLWLTLENKKERPYKLNYAIQINYLKSEAGRDILQKALENKVDISFIHEEINKNARKPEQIDSIKESLKQLQLNHPTNVELDIAIARIDFLQGDFESALANSKRLKKALGDNKFGIESYLILAFSQNQNDQLKDAIKSLEQASLYHKDKLRILTPLLNFLLQDDQIELSKQYYRGHSLAEQESIQLSLNYIGQLLEHQHSELALSLLKELDYPSTGLADQFYYLEANALSQVDKKEDGIALLLKTTGPLKLNATEQAASWLYELKQENRINPMVMSRVNEQQNLDMVLSICFLHEDEGRLDLADQLLTSALAIYKNANSLRYKRALLADQRGFWLETEKELSYLVSLEPENPQYLNALGYTLLQYTKRLDEAMELIEKAYQINGEDPAIIDSLGWGHFLLGNNEQAIFYLKKAWDLLKDPEIGAHFGEALWQKNPEQANLIWRQALDNEQNHDTLMETIKRLNPNFEFPDNKLQQTSPYTDIAQDQTP